MGLETRQNGQPSSTDQFLNLIADPFQAEVRLLIPQLPAVILQGA